MSSPGRLLRGVMSQLSSAHVQPYAHVMQRLGLALAAAIIILGFSTSAQAAPSGSEIKFESIRLTNAAPPITLELAYRPNVVPKYSAILMLGVLQQKDGSWEPPKWSANLLQEGYMLAAFRAERAPDPDPARRPQWLHFDERFAHNYVEAGLHAPKDAGRVIDYLQSRGNAHKFGWIGSSSTGIPGLSVAVKEPRLNAVVAFVSTGAYQQWLDSWHTHGLWRGNTRERWPETEKLLPEVDPILHVKNMFPCAVLMVSGSEDKVVDPKTAKAFADAARPFYASDPDRLRLVLYEGFAHNLPPDVVPMYIESWFHTYLHPTQPAPRAADGARNLNESVKRTSVTGVDHKEVINAK